MTTASQPNLEARRLTRRLARGDRTRLSRRWGVIGSVWAHLFAVLALWLTRAPAPPPPPPPPPTELVLLAPIRVERVQPRAVEARQAGVPLAGARGGGAGLPAEPRPVEPPGTPEPGGEPDATSPAAPGPRARVAPPSDVDPAEALRLALGWGPLDRSRLAPRRTLSAAMFADLGPGGTADPSPPDEVDVDWRAASQVQGTALGAWVERAEALVFARWRERDLDLHSKAIGIQGEVVVAYVVAASGQVTQVRVTRSSGTPALDAMAVHAIPDRLPRLPKEAGLDALNHEITFRYLNPPVAGHRGG